MNLRNTMVCLFGLSIAACQSMRADEDEAAADTEAAVAPATDEVWDGHGAVFDAEGRAQGEYDVRLTRHRREGGVDQSVDVTLPDGNVMHFAQAINGTGDRFVIESADGNGGGYSLGDGLLLTYTGEGTTGQAQTIIDDGEGRMRIVRTELDGGEAVRFFRESYVRQ